MAAACTSCCGTDAKEVGWTVPSVLVEMPSTRHGPDADLSQLQDQMQADMARIHTLLQDKLCSDMAQIFARLEVLESHIGVKRSSTDCEPNSQPQHEAGFDEVDLQVISDDTRGDTVIAEPVGRAAESFEEFSEVHFEESVWSIPVVSGLVDVGCFDKLFAGMLVLLNLGMQAAFSWVLLTDDFIGDGFESQVDSAKVWRTSVAHDHKYMDLADTSLVSRVCSGDGALILSTNQATLVEHINSFLGLEADDFGRSIFQPGVLLCMLCIIQWSLCVYKEFRRIWLQLEAVVAVPRSCRTIFRDNSFDHMSWGRFCILLVTYLARVAIASVLLFGGVMWLARTTSIEELMLNAVALNSILDIDEFLFAGMTPVKIQHAIQTLAPMKIKYSRARSQCESLLHFSSLLALVLTSYFLLLVPLSDTMLAVKSELCGGIQKFVVSYNAETQLTIGLVTADSRDARNLSASEAAVQEFKDSLAEAVSGSIRFSPSKDMFQQDISRSMREEASTYPFCLETALLNEDGQFYADATLQGLADVFFNSAAASVGRTGVQSCEELKGDCDSADGRLVRLVCGETCGCLDPLSSAWYKVEAQGCSAACLELAQQSLQNRSCQDAPVDDTWRAFWDRYPSALSAHFGQRVQDTEAFRRTQQVIAALRVGGCPILTRFPVDILTGAAWCEGLPDLFRPLSPFCPQTCGCDKPSQTHSYCPPSCITNSSDAADPAPQSR